MKIFIVGTFASLFSLLLGLFILPQEVELIRFMDIQAQPEVVWSSIATVEAWDAWEPYKKKASGNTRPWSEGMLTIVSVDPDKQEIRYEIDANEAKGDLSLALKPANEGVIVRWHHRYKGGYWPWERVDNWFSRAELALKFDEGLHQLRINLEKK
ncbi:MAG: hypothetical protein CL916_06445 [Deltaproteobacteria bacterium]|nr:hypothetical protein [Deltaproteobacteria bacterium]